MTNQGTNFAVAPTDPDLITVIQYHFNEPDSMIFKQDSLPTELSPICEHVNVLTVTNNIV